MFSSLLPQPGLKKCKLSKIELIYKAKKFKVHPFTKSAPFKFSAYRSSEGSKGPGLRFRTLRVTAYRLIDMGGFPNIGDPNIVP